MVALRLLPKWSQPGCGRCENKSVKWRRDIWILNLFLPCLLGPGEALQVVSTTSQPSKQQISLYTKAR